MAICLRGALPPTDLRAACFVRAIVFRRDSLLFTTRTEPCPTRLRGSREREPVPVVLLFKHDERHARDAWMESHRNRSLCFCVFGPKTRSMFVLLPLVSVVSLCSGKTFLSPLCVLVVNRGHVDGIDSIAGDSIDVPSCERTVPVCRTASKLYFVSLAFRVIRVSLCVLRRYILR